MDTLIPKRIPQDDILVQFHYFKNVLSLMRSRLVIKNTYISCSSGCFNSSLLSSREVRGLRNKIHPDLKCRLLLKITSSFKRDTAVTSLDFTYFKLLYGVVNVIKVTLLVFLKYEREHFEI